MGLIGSEVGKREENSKLVPGLCLWVGQDKVRTLWWQALSRPLLWVPVLCYIKGGL